MKKNKVISCILFLVLCMTMLFSGCGTKEESNEKKENSETRSYDVENMKFDNVKIHVMTRITNEGSQKYFADKIDEFNNLDNGITVELENITTEEDYLNKLRTGYSGGDTPNVFTEYGGARVKDYIAANGVLDWTPYLEADKEYYDSFYDSEIGRASCRERV